MAVNGNGNGAGALDRRSCATKPARSPTPSSLIVEDHRRGVRRAPKPRSDRSTTR